MVKINGTELIEVDHLPANGMQRAGCRTGVPSFASLDRALNLFLDRCGLPRTEHGDFRQQTRAEHRVVRIKRTELSRAQRRESEKLRDRAT